MRTAPGVVIALLLASPARADGPFDPRNYDKIAHATTSYALTLSIDVVARKLELPRWQAYLLGAAATALVGTTKELVFDSVYDWGDQLANGVGIAVATGFVVVVKL